MKNITVSLAEDVEGLIRVRAGEELSRSVSNRALATGAQEGRAGTDRGRDRYGALSGEKATGTELERQLEANRGSNSMTAPV